MQNSDALASSIFDALGEDPDEALLLVCNGSITEVIQTDALKAVYFHKERAFPWSDEAVAQVVEEEKHRVAVFSQTLHDPGLQFLNGANIITRGGGASHSLDDLRGMECVGLYFSAHWCPPCRSFTPVLARVYQQLADEGRKFGVVFVSSDKNAEKFQEYFDMMPWVALAFDQRELKNLLSQAFEVQGIPTLVLVYPQTGKFNASGRSIVDKWKAEAFPWGDEQLSAARSAEAAMNAQLDLQWRAAGKVVLKQHRGVGKRHINHTVEFDSFNTFVADVKLSNGRFYFEVEVLSLQGVVQFGVCTDGFDARVDPDGDGVGDDEFSFAVDGVRQRKWPGQDFGSEWADGHVIGFAIDMGTVGCASMSVSVNGSFSAPNGVAFDSIAAAWLSPAFTGSSGEFRINFGDTPFKYSPPDASFISVHDEARARS
jgi:nucleoredoxin